MINSIKDWFEEVGSGVTAVRPGSLHLDEVNGWSIGEGTVKFVFSCFQELWEAVERSELSHDCVLVWPLGCTDGLTVEAPQTLIVDDEPPSIYLMHPDAAKLPEFGEEYRKPISPEKLGLSFPGGYAYYRCFRPPEGIENDWEYERCLYFVRK